MTKDWHRLGAYIGDRRVELGLTQQQAADAGGVSLAVWGLLERGQQDRPRPASLAAVDKALQWERGSAQRVAEGGEPSPLNPRDATDSVDLLPRRDPVLEAVAVLMREVRDALVDLQAAVEEVRELQRELGAHPRQPPKPPQPPTERRGRRR